jgi:hypothetical protein
MRHYLDDPNDEDEGEKPGGGDPGNDPPPSE